MWTGGVAIQEAASEGMESAKADSPWRHLCPPQARRVALSPQGPSWWGLACEEVLRVRLFAGSRRAGLTCPEPPLRILSGD